MYKLGICGHFGTGRELLNGQTIKTKNIAAVLIKEFGEEQVFSVDTHEGIKAIFRLCVQVCRMFSKCRNIIFLPAQHALLFLGPLFFFYNRIFHRSLHYVVIGGWLPQFLKEHKWIYVILKEMKGIYVETSEMKKLLEERKMKNVYLMRNFKTGKPITQRELVYAWTRPYPLCTFSRIVKEKGIEDAVKAVILVNEKLGTQVFRLDIYGLVEPAYQTRWEKLKKNFPEYIHCVGPVPVEKSREIIRNYYALLFPTFYAGEGLAGTLIDAMSAGVPVIASDWKYNCETVIPNRTGILVPPGNPEKLMHCLLEIAGNPEWWNGMKLTCLEEAGRYVPEQVTKVLIENLE